MDYNYSLKKDNIDYGFVKGNNKIVFIKSGLGGNYLGYENKYLIMAYQLHDKYGCSVIVSSNPHDGITLKVPAKTRLSESLSIIALLVA